MMNGSKIIFMLAVSLLLTGCSTYGSSFSCGDSRGATCMPMDKVDRLIRSGEIEEYTKENKGKCRGGRCKNKTVSTVIKEDELPSLTRSDINLKTTEN